MATPGSRSHDSESSMRDRAQHFAGQVVDKVQETAGRVVGSGQTGSQPGSLTDQATSQVTEQVTSRLDMGKDYLVETMTGVAQALRQTGQHLREEGAQPMLAQYVDQGATQIERIGGHMRQRDAKELVAEIEWFARRQPMTFAASAFALGMLAVRFLRAGSSGAQQQMPSSSGAASSSASFGTSSSMTQRFGGVTGSTPPSGTPGYGTGTTTPPRPAPGAAGSTPSGMPATQRPPMPSQRPEYTDAGLGLNPSTPAAPGMTPERLGTNPTPSTGTGVPPARPGVGDQSGGRAGSDAPRPGRTNPGSRNQP